MDNLPIAQQIAAEITQNKELIKNTFFKEGTMEQFELFCQVAKKVGLSPLNRQITPMLRRSKNKKGDWETVMTIITNIDGFRLIAERSGKYAGQKGPYWAGKDGKWLEVWPLDTPPYAAKVGALRTDFQEPLWAVVKWDSYVQTHKNKDTGKWEVSSTWRKMPDLMLAKVAEAMALRKAFPNDLAGLYGQEEMDQAKTDENAAAPKDVTPPPAAAQAKQKESSPPQQKTTKRVEDMTDVDLANFVFPFKKFKDKRLCDIDLNELQSYADWMATSIESDKGQGKKVNASAELVLDVVDRWLQVGGKTGAGTAKGSGAKTKGAGRNGHQSGEETGDEGGEEKLPF